jgi:hypothetical protein
MGTINKDVQGTTGGDGVTYTISDVSSGDLIAPGALAAIAVAVNSERERRGGTAQTYTFTGVIDKTEIQALIDGIEGVNPPLRGSGFTTNPGTVSAAGSGDNTDVQHADEVDLAGTNAPAYTGGIRSLSSVIYASEINSIIDKVQAAGAVCTCNCNYCTCNCNYCTCNCNYACTCNCNY